MQKDIMKYGKAQGMSLVGTYLPELNWFQSFTLIDTLEEWEELKPLYASNAIHRIDYPIGQGVVQKNAVDGTNGFASSVPELLATIQAQGGQGAVLLVKTTLPSPPRYLYLGGFSILFQVGTEIIIELVGQAFDGHELTQGLACHERYCFAWDDAPYLMTRSQLLHHGALKHIVSSRDYANQRDARAEFLIQDCHYDSRSVWHALPQRITLIDNSSFETLVDKVVLPLRDQQLTLQRRGMTTFGVQGNIVKIDSQVRIQPWEIFRPERWT